MGSIGIVDCIVELKFLVGQLSQFSIVEPSRKDIDILRSILEIVKDVDVPEILGVSDGEAQKEYN